MSGYPAWSLKACLDHEPVPLRFGTSGRRGRVQDLTQLEIYICVSAELDYLLSLPKSKGGIVKGEKFFVGYDLRPSSTQYVDEFGGRGEIAQAVIRAILDMGLLPVNLGPIPTPAVMYYATRHRCGSIMVTGSHIPFDRNGYKTHSSIGELMKADEAPIAKLEAKWRHTLYSELYERSIFDRSGRFKSGHHELPPIDTSGASLFLKRYVDFFGAEALKGMRVVVYQHSAVARDLLPELLSLLGAEVIPVGRTDEFVAIDTENIQEDLLLQIQQYVDIVWAEHGPVDAVVSTDGDSDRPLVIAVDKVADGGKQKGRVKFLSGDLVGLLVSRYLGADAVVVPISCNDAVDLSGLNVYSKTRIGSPYVIAAMRQAHEAGFQRVCGWEANGGFILGTDIERNGHVLSALLTRDSFLPIVSVLRAAKEKQVPVWALFEKLPRRFSRSSLIRNVPRELGRQIVKLLSLDAPEVVEIVLKDRSVELVGLNGVVTPPPKDSIGKVNELFELISRFFRSKDGFGRPIRVNFLDGVRIWFDNGDIAHVRPSGNADELRIYAVADTQERADQIVRLAVAEPDGILRRLEQCVLEAQS